MLLENLINSSFFSPDRVRRLPFQIFVLGVLCTAASFLVLEITPGADRDFLGYWVATHSFFDGKNPYDASIIAAWRAAQNYLGDETLLVWNPPLAFLLLAPIMLLPLKLAAAIWQGLNVIFALGTVLLCWPKNSARHPTLLGLAAISGLFIPLWFVFSLGQLSLFLVFCVALSLRALDQKRDISAGLLLACLCIKPHISFLLLFYVLLSVLKSHRYKILSTLAVTVCVISAAAEILHPGIHSSWIGSNNWPPVLFGSSFALAVWFLISGFANSLALKALLIVFPLIGLIILAWWNRTEGVTPFSRRGYALALLLTPFFTPYGFIFDQAVLLPILAWTALSASEGEGNSGQACLFFWWFLITDAIVVALGSIAVGPVLLIWYLPIFQVLLLSKLNYVSLSPAKSLR